MSKVKLNIAITGTIASGKSTVSSYLRKLGYEVFDVDKYNAQLLKKDNKGYGAIIKHFDVLDSNGEIDKKRLANIIFNDEYKRELLNSLLHPLIKEELLGQMKDKELFIAEVPLLFEVGWNRYFDENLLVVANEESIISRLIAKGYSEKEAKERLNAQMSVTNKMALASHVIYNYGTLEELYKSVDEWRDNLKI